VGTRVGVTEGSRVGVTVGEVDGRCVHARMGRETGSDSKVKADRR
jgi:hypothetical protein